jgi:hypothetical protein
MLIDGELFALYNFNPNAQGIFKPFFHPIIGPSGLSITQNGEYSGTLHGHYWHRGLMIAHQWVNGTSFWEERQEDCGRMIHQSFEEISNGSDKGSFTELLAWTALDGIVPIREERHVELLCDPSGTRCLDFCLKLTANAGDVEFGKTSYGLLAAKASARLHVGDHDPAHGALAAKLVNLTGHQQGGQITFSDGETNMRHTSQNGISIHADWGDYSGPPESKEGYVIFDHPSNPRHPTTWLNWNNMTIGPSPTFEEPMRITNGESVQFAYRFLVHAENAASADIQQHYENYAQKKVI